MILLKMKDTFYFSLNQNIIELLNKVIIKTNNHNKGLF